MERLKPHRKFAPLYQSIRYKALFGGRASGKSWAVAEALVLMGADRPLFILCAREIQNSIRDSVKRLIDNTIDQLNLRSFYTSTDNEIRGRNGTTFVFKGLRHVSSETLKGWESVDICWIEEARDVSAATWRTLRPTIRKPGSEIWVTWNPKFADDPIDEFFRGKEPPNNAFIQQVTWRDNPGFSQESYDDMCRDYRRDHAMYLHVWEGDYLTYGEELVFNNWHTENFITPTDVERFYFGADWGFAVDPTVLIRAFIDQEKRRLYIDGEAWKVNCDIDHTPALFAGDDTREPPRWSNPNRTPGVEGALKWPIVADSARPEMIAYMKKRGFKMKAAAKGAGSIEDGIDFVKNYDMIIHSERCPHTVKEVGRYRYKRDERTDEVLPILVDKDNNTIDALRYSVEGVRKATTFRI